MPTSLTKRYYRPREVCEIVGISIACLRNWESVFPQLQPVRTNAGHRRYRAEDVEVARMIKYMMRDKGLSLVATMRELDALSKLPPKRPVVCNSPGDALRLVSEAAERCPDAFVAVRVVAVRDWLAKFFK